MDATRWCLVAADALMLLHFVIVLFVVLSVPVIWSGFWLKKPFARNRTFRFVHLGAMAFVLVQALVGEICPLTKLEMALRLKAGGGVYAASFIQHWVHKALYLDLSQATFTWVYGIFFGLIVLTMIVVPPGRRKKPTTQNSAG